MLLAALIRIAQRLIVRRLGRLARRTTTEADDLVVDLLRRVSLVFIVAGCAVLVAAWLPVTDGVHRLLRTAFVLACVYQAGVWGNGVIAVSSIAGRRPPGAPPRRRWRRSGFSAA